MRFSVGITGVSELEDSLEEIAKKLAEQGRRDPGHARYGLADVNRFGRRGKAAPGIPGRTKKPLKAQVKGWALSTHTRGLTAKKGRVI